MSRGADVVADEADGRVQLPHALAALAVVVGVHELRREVDVHVLLEPLDDTEGGVAEERVQVRTRAQLDGLGYLVAHRRNEGRLARGALVYA